MFKKFSIIISTLLLFCCFFNSNSHENDFIYPVTNTRISSNFGYRNLFGKNSYHNGLDFPLPQGTKVLSSANGVVTFAGFNKDYGNCIIILHNNRYKSLYGHLSEDIIVKEGDHILKGQLIAYIGPKILSNGLYNGITTGPHLHFSIFNDKGTPINPKDIIKSK